MMLSARLGVMKIGIIQRNGFQALVNCKQLRQNFSTHTVKDPGTSALFAATLNTKWLKNSAILFSTEPINQPGNPNIFGDISGNHYEKMELDDDEKEQDEFEKNESRIPRKFRMSPGRYADLISDHIARGDLFSAMNVLEMVKHNRDKPTSYMYNLLIRGYAVQGNLKKCLKLYNAMKKRALPQNAATYTSMFNACANSSDRQLSIEKLNDLRHELLQKNIPLNDTHYNVMIKAYAKHNCIFEAFQLVDEMVDKRLCTGEITFNSLLFASISDKANGLKHALVVWHLMQQRRIKPSILTYNLLLRAVRDTEFGDLNINDQLVQSLPRTQILLTDGTTPDLLATQPIVTHFAIQSIVDTPVKIQSTSIQYKSSSAPSVTNNKEEKLAQSSASSSSAISLDSIHKKNRMILFGGYTGFIERMEKDNVTPNAKTLTLLIDIVPNSLSIEKDIIQIARTKKIPLDIDFFNMLIKKRSCRGDYKNAKVILDEIQLFGLTPDIITWGVLAMGCRTHDEAHALLEGMEATGHTLNPIIATTLLSNACETNHFVYILDIMQLMYKQRVRPTELTYKILDRFQRKISDIVLCKVKSKHSKNPRYKELYSKFNLRYDSWQQQFQRDKENTRIHK